MSDSYKKSGVDIDIDKPWIDFIKQSSGLGASKSLLAKEKKLISKIGEYAAVYEISADSLIACCVDGIGSKLLWTLQGLGSMESVAQDLVAMNVNDLICVGADPVLFFDYLAVGNPKMLQGGGLLQGFIKGIQAACAKSGCLLAGGETAQLPDIYKGNEFDASGTAIGTLNSQNYLSTNMVEQDSELWYWPSSGPHSNGYTWLRKIFNPKDDKQFIQQELMNPTSLYVESFKGLKNFCQLKKSKFTSPIIQSVYHITGGGMLNLLRAQSENKFGFQLSKLYKDELPLWVKEVKQRTNSSWEEILKSFNCGIGLVIVIDKNFAKEFSAELGELKLQKLGKIISQQKIIIEDFKIELCPQ